MRTLLRVALGTLPARLITLLGTYSLFYGGGRVIHDWIDNTIASAGLAFVLIIVWMALALFTGLVTVVVLADRIFYRGWIDRLLSGESVTDVSDLGGDLEGDSVEQLSGDLALASGRLRDIGARFSFYFLAFSVANLLLADHLAGGFLARFSHPGFAVIMMRSESATDRRKGLENLAEKLDIDPNPAVRDVVLRALDDPDEGVAARAAFVAGYLRMPEAAPGLARMARERPALTFSALIALGQLGPKAARETARRLADDEAAREEPLALAYMLGLVRYPAIERLREIERTAKDDGVRVAAVWALGELRERKLVDFIAGVLESDSLAVRCAAIGALEKMVVFRASAPLRRLFEASRDPELMCPQTLVPVQEGGPNLVVIPYRNYELAIVRALATTDDPALIPWLVKHQEGRQVITNHLMRKLWESLRDKKKRGQLNSLERVHRLEILRRRDAGSD